MNYGQDLIQIFPKEVTSWSDMILYLEDLTDSDVIVGSNYIKLDDYDHCTFRIKFRYLKKDKSMAAQFTVLPNGDFHVTIVNEHEIGYRKDRFEGNVKQPKFWESIRF